MSDTIQDSIYPLTITADRYSGVYSGGNFIAWNLDADEIPDDIYSDDCGCHEFWLTNKIPVGKGKTVEEAIGNLYIILNGGKVNENETEDRSDFPW